MGQGRPLILCHGFLSSAEEFGGRFRALAAHRRLIIPDLPGNGDSSALAGCHTVEAMAMALESLLAGLGIGEFDIAGLCLGASVAGALAERCGDRVDRLVLHTPLLASALIRVHQENGERSAAAIPRPSLFTCVPSTASPETSWAASRRLPRDGWEPTAAPRTCDVVAIPVWHRRVAPRL